MICFEILSDFWKNRKNEQTGKSGHRAPTPQRREPTPWHSPTPQCGMPLTWRGWGAKMPAPWVRYSVALLHHSVAVLRRDVATVHREQISNFCSESLVFVTDSLRTLIND